MSVRLKHLVTKKIDYTDNRTFFFEVTERPNGMFKVSFIFEYADGEKFKTGIEAESMPRQQWKSIKKTADKTPSQRLVYGYFPVVVPRGEDVVRIHYGAKYGVLGQVNEVCPNLDFNREIQDVMKHEEYYNNVLKPKIANGEI